MTTRISLILSLVAALAAPVFAETHSLQVVGNRITLDGKKGQVIYRSSGDLDGDHKEETVFSMSPIEDRMDPVIVVARSENGTWQAITTEEDGCYDLRVDVTDINGDRRREIVARGVSGDGHDWCDIFVLDGTRLKSLASFHVTKFKDLDGDGVVEVLSTEAIAAMALGDQWLTIYKWERGKGYVDVSRQFPKEYDAVIARIRRVITKNPDAGDMDLGNLHYYLGKAYEYRGLPNAAKEEYANAYKLIPYDEDVTKDYKRTDPDRR